MNPPRNIMRIGSGSSEVPNVYDVIEAAAPTGFLEL